MPTSGTRYRMDGPLQQKTSDLVGAILVELKALRMIDATTTRFPTSWQWAGCSRGELQRALLNMMFSHPAWKPKIERLPAATRVSFDGLLTSWAKIVGDDLATIAKSIPTTKQTDEAAA
jgi:hypothetical protein